MAHTNGTEYFWPMMRRGYDGAYHHLSGAHLHIYGHKFAGRHNIGDTDTIDMMGTMAEQWLAAG